MTTVIGEDGHEHQVIGVEAVASIASINTLNSEFPPNAAKIIEQAMAGAVRNCYESGETDPVKIRKAMQDARESVKMALRAQQAEERSAQE